MEVIYAIPGLGTNKELYRNLRVAGHALKILEWPLPDKGGSLPAYAARFLTQIPEQQRPVKLIGVSFGGMICTELSELVPVKKVVLISSCANRKQFPKRLKVLRYLPVYKVIPDALLRALAKSARSFLGFEPAFAPTFRNMIDSMPAGYFSYCIHYILNWQRTTHPAGIVQLHGTADGLLTHYSSAAYKIHDGSHSMVLNRADEINKILDREFNGD